MPIFKTSFCHGDAYVLIKLKWEDPFEENLLNFCKMPGVIHAETGEERNMFCSAFKSNRFHVSLPVSIFISFVFYPQAWRMIPIVSGTLKGKSEREKFSANRNFFPSSDCKTLFVNVFWALFQSHVFLYFQTFWYFSLTLQYVALSIWLKWSKNNFDQFLKG